MLNIPMVFPDALQRFPKLNLWGWNGSDPTSDTTGNPEKKHTILQEAAPSIVRSKHEYSDLLGFWRSENVGWNRFESPNNLRTSSPERLVDRDLGRHLQESSQDVAMDNQYRYVPSTMPYYKECILMWVLCGFLEIEYCTQFPGFTIAFWNLPWLCEIARGLKMCSFPTNWTFIIVVSCWNKHNQWIHSNIPVPISSGEYTKPIQTLPCLILLSYCPLSERLGAGF